MRRGIRQGIRLKYIKRVTKPSGAVLLYLNRPGMALVRLPDAPMDSPEFLAAYAAAMKGGKPKGRAYPTGSLAAAVKAYQASDTFLALHEMTRDSRRRILSKIVEKGGGVPFDRLEAQHIENDIANLTPHPARNRLKAWRGLCAWAKEAKLVKVDPSADVSRPKAPASDGHQAWTYSDLAVFRDYWPEASPERLAFELLQWTAARSGDAVRLGPGMIDRAGWLGFRQGKTGGDVAIPLARALPAFADADDHAYLMAALTHAPAHMTWIVTGRGAARSHKAFSAWFAAAARKAGVNKSAHGLRKYRATMLAEGGATAHQIMAWTGHESLSEAERYAKKADKRRILSGTDEDQKLDPARAISKTGE